MGVSSEVYKEVVIPHLHMCPLARFLMKVVSYSANTGELVLASDSKRANLFGTMAYTNEKIDDLCAICQLENIHNPQPSLIAVENLPGVYNPALVLQTK